VSTPEMNLDVDAPDKVAAVLTAAASAYQESAIELSAAWQDRQIPMIWADSLRARYRRVEDREDRQAAARRQALSHAAAQVAVAAASSAAVEGARGVKSNPAPKEYPDEAQDQIDCSNAAFEDWGTARQARFTPLKFTDSIAAIEKFDRPFALPLFDSNGNCVGAASVSDK
jgi:hypothetical protein